MFSSFFPRSHGYEHGTAASSHGPGRQCRAYLHAIYRHFRSIEGRYHPSLPSQHRRGRKSIAPLASMETAHSSQPAVFRMARWTDLVWDPRKVRGLKTAYTRIFSTCACASRTRQNLLSGTHADARMSVHVHCTQDGMVEAVRMSRLALAHASFAPQWGGRARHFPNQDVSMENTP